MSNFLVMLVMLVIAVQTQALEPLPQPTPIEPRNKKAVAAFAEAADLPVEGWYVYALPGKDFGTGVKFGKGLVVSPLRRFQPVPVPGVDDDIGVVDISDDGQWILFSTPEAAWLVRPDGSGRTRVPGPTEPIRKGPDDYRFVTAGFIHHGPFGDEVFYAAGNRLVRAVRVDLRGATPTFGPERTVADFTRHPEPETHFRLSDTQEQHPRISRDHFLFNCGGWAGSAIHTMVTIPDGGKGIATHEHVAERKGPPKWECGPALSHDGRLVAQNPGGGDKEVLPVEIGHKGPVVYPFLVAPGSAEVRKGQYIDQALAICWVPESVRAAKGDWHHWAFTNDPAYLIGLNQGERGNRGPDDLPAIGIYLLHWPSGRYYRVSDPKVRTMTQAAYRVRPDVPMARMPPGMPLVGAGGVQPRGGSPTATPPAKAAAATLVVDAVLRQVSHAPTVADLGPYKHIVVVHRYQVARVIKGKYMLQDILIAHWGIQDRKPQPAASFQVGNRYRITCDGSKDYASMTLQQTVDEIQDPELDVWWALEVVAQPSR